VLTPQGRAYSETLVKDLDLAALTAEAAARGGMTLGGAMHPTIPSHQGPPELPVGLRQLLAGHPFELNAFAMTRFPEERPDGPADPVAAAVSVAVRCASFRLGASSRIRPSHPRRSLNQCHGPYVGKQVWRGLL
jgi:hypothetical protein